MKKLERAIAIVRGAGLEITLDRFAPGSSCVLRMRPEVDARFPGRTCSRQGTPLLPAALTARAFESRKRTAARIIRVFSIGGQ